MRVAKVFKVCLFHFSKWRGNRRVILTFLLGGIMMFLLTEKIVDFSQQENTFIQILEPFIWSFDEKQSILLSSLLIILLFSDLPYTDGSIPYFMFRTSRSIWSIGQFLYMVIATLLYVVYITFIGALFSSQNAFIGNKWSETAAMLGFSRYSDILEIPAELKTMQMVTPYQCAFRIMLLLYLYIFLSVLIMMYFTYSHGKKAGIISVLIFHTWGIALNSDFLTHVMNLSDIQRYRADLICAWLSPISHVTYHMHNFGYDYLPTLAMSGVILSIAILFVCILIHIRMKKYNFYFTGMDN